MEHTHCTVSPEDGRAYLARRKPAQQFQEPERVQRLVVIEPLLGAFIQELLHQCGFNAQEHSVGGISWVMRVQLARLR